MAADSRPLDFYAQPSFIADPKDHAALFAALPVELTALSKAVQGLLLHQYWAEAYGYSIPAERVRVPDS